MRPVSATITRALTGGLMATTALCVVAPSFAQEGLEEIVVTAQRREQSLQDVPIAVTAFTGADLERIGAPDIITVGQSVPNLTLKRSRATNSTLTAFIRGVGQQDPVAGFEQGVGMYLDDVYLNRPQGAVLDIFDVERVEVLRGPQGTLYGRNTIGGAVKFVTKRLPDEPEFEVRGSFGTYHQADLVAKANVPVGEALRIGVAGARYTRDGFGKNLYTGADNYNKDEWATRGTIEITPSDNMFMRLTGDYTKDNSNPRHGHRLIPAKLSAGFPVLPDVYDTQAGVTAPPKPEVLNRGMSFLLQLEGSDQWTFKNIFAYRSNRSGQLIDFESLPVIDVESPYVLSDHQTSEEIQALYNGENMQGVVGFYYLNASAYNEFDVLLARTGALIGLPGLNAYTYGKVGTDTWSLYGDMTFDLEKMIGWNGFELSLGGRYTTDQRTGRIIRRTYIGGRSAKFGNTGTVLATTSDFTGQDTFKDFTPRAVLTFKPDADNTLYASFSQGFKGGGFDPRGQTTAAPDLNRDGTRSAQEIFDFMEFLPENITTYELGWKTEAMNGRVRSNMDVFYSDYKNVQIPGSIGVDTNGDGVADNFSGVTTNAGKARFYGAEFEGTAILAEDAATSGDSFKANWSVGWIDAKYQEFFVAVTSGGVASLQNVAKLREVQNTPEWTVNFGLNYTTPMEAFGYTGEIAFLPSISYRSFSTQFEYRSPIDQPGYALVDASIVWTADSSGLQIGLHGKNLTDKKYKVAGYDFVTATTLGVEGALTAFYGDPLTVTATVGLKF